jgi:hypothetical protein
MPQKQYSSGVRSGDLDGHFIRFIHIQSDRYYVMYERNIADQNSTVYIIFQNSFNRFVFAMEM